MQMQEILRQMGGLQSIARELGVSEAEVARGAEALSPALLGGFKRQAQAQPAGLGGFEQLLGQLGGGGLLEDVLGAQPTNVARGNDILGSIFGSRDVSRTVAQHASTQSGVSPELLKRMLPMLAMLVAGYFAKRGSGAAPSGGGGLGDLLGGLLGSGGPSPGGRQAAAPGIESMLDLNGDGNALDDIMNMAGGLFGSTRR